MRRNGLSLMILAVLAGFAAVQAYAAASAKHAEVAAEDDPPREDTKADPPISISSAF